MFLVLQIGMFAHNLLEIYIVFRKTHTLWPKQKEKLIPLILGLSHSARSLKRLQPHLVWEDRNELCTPHQQHLHFSSDHPIHDQEFVLIKNRGSRWLLKPVKKTLKVRKANLSTITKQQIQAPGMYQIVLHRKRKH